MRYIGVVLISFHKEYFKLSCKQIVPFQIYENDIMENNRLTVNTLPLNMHIKSATDVVGIFWNNIQCLNFISGEGGGGIGCT